jgi:hypothetical protein
MTEKASPSARSGTTTERTWFRSSQLAAAAAGVASKPTVNTASMIDSARDSKRRSNLRHEPAVGASVETRMALSREGRGLHAPQR